MQKSVKAIIFLLLAITCTTSAADNDTRQLVQLPKMMQEHMMSNMRDHLAAINEILLSMGSGDLYMAAKVAEQRLGMSSLQSHGASQMAKYMPEGMRQMGTNMHRAASRFAMKVQEKVEPPRQCHQVIEERVSSGHVVYPWWGLMVIGMKL